VRRGLERVVCGHILAVSHCFLDLSKAACSYFSILLLNSVGSSATNWSAKRMAKLTALLPPALPSADAALVSVAPVEMCKKLAGSRPRVAGEVRQSSTEGRRKMQARAS